MMKKINQSWRKLCLTMLLIYLKRMVLISGLKKKQWNYYQKDLHILVHQTIFLEKKQISWMFGLILVLPFQEVYLIKTTIIQLTCILKDLTNIVGGLIVA